MSGAERRIDPFEKEDPLLGRRNDRPVPLAQRADDVAPPFRQVEQLGDPDDRREDLLDRPRFDRFDVGCGIERQESVADGGVADGADGAENGGCRCAEGADVGRRCADGAEGSGESVGELGGGVAGGCVDSGGSACVSSWIAADPVRMVGASLG